ncbi:uncharacterized protein [Antedon mediterranea]|uniref:uncharacterized protein isoform X2 n=1 Tax=Antedon mediterranea TaxID=105859 RepID=UPI003AF44178
MMTGISSHKSLTIPLWTFQIISTIICFSSGTPILDLTPIDPYQLAGSDLNFTCTLDKKDTSWNASDIRWNIDGKDVPITANNTAVISSTQAILTLTNLTMTYDNDYEQWIECFLGKFKVNSISALTVGIMPSSPTLHCRSTNIVDYWCEWSTEFTGVRVVYNFQFQYFIKRCLWRNCVKMPKCKSVATLQQICLQFVGNNMDFWCRNFVDNYKVMKTYKYFIGPFDDLSSNMSEKIMVHLMVERNLKKPYLHLLINHSLVNLDLSGCPMLVKDDIINLAKFRCKSLTSINLSNCMQVKRGTLVSLAEAYPNLMSLNLNGTNCKEEAAKAVFKHCTMVTDLILSNCQLNDDDLAVLINSVKEKRTHSNLRKLSLSNTDVTHQALITVLRNLPWVVVLEHFDLTKSLYAMSKDASGQHDTLNLRSLVVDGKPNVYNNVLICCFILCPQLVKIELIELFSCDNDYFEELGNLQMLRDLKVVGHRHIMLDFFGVLQALPKIGPNLQILVLEEIDGIDVLKTAKLCPNLSELSLCIHDENLSFYSELEEMTNTNISMTKLKRVTIGGNGADADANADAVLTKFLSACPALEHLKLVQLNKFTNDVIRDTLRVNEMPQLTSLELFSCTNMTAKVLGELIISSNNKLLLVKLINCWNITRKDYLHWLVAAKESNYDLDIQWE